MRHVDNKKQDPHLLVGHDTSDDAGVYQLTDELAMIQTLDYFTPIVDDPYMFGQIAAANALSDVYAMGGEVKTALNIVGYPIKTLGSDLLGSILQGAQDKVHESGGVIVGGHSIDDQEPKFGLSVTGIIHPSEIYTNAGAQQGDVLVLTKPIGVGIQTTGIKREKLSIDQIETVSSLMAQLNKIASESLRSFNVNAVTDVTGFGLLGHASEIARGSNVSLRFNYQDIPILSGTKELALEGIIPGGTKKNHNWLQPEVTYHHNIREVEQMILCDAITSGGLLISMPEEDARGYIDTLSNKGVNDVAIIGQVVKREEKLIYVDE